MYWDNIYFCRKNYALLNKRFYKKGAKNYMVPNWFFDHLQSFLAKPFFDQVPKKGSALVKFINLSTRGECIEFGQYLPIKIKLFLSLSYMFFFISMFISESWEVAQSRKNWQIKNLFVNLYRLLTLIEKPCDFVEGLQLVTLSSL